MRNSYYYIPSILCCAIATTTLASTNTSRPNIVLICADDLGFSDIGCYGSEIQTPNLDALAKRGLRFTNMHNIGKSFPSRASLLTGLYAQQCGYSQSYSGKLIHAVTLGEVLREAGYRTLWSGKHHGRENPTTRGFDHYYGLRDGCCNYFNPGLAREGEGRPAQKNAKGGMRAWCIEDKLVTPYTPPMDFYATDYFTDYALNWLEKYKKEDKPFFLYLAYTAPHDPLQAKSVDIAKYKGRYREGYEKIRKARYNKQLKIGLLDERWRLSEPKHSAWSEVSPKEQLQEEQRMEVYAAMIDCMDQNIGRVLDRLKAYKKLDNTIIIFVSDNGCSAQVVNIPTSTGQIGSMTNWQSLGGDWSNVCNTPYRYDKVSSYEGGVNTPMIVSWPKGLNTRGVSNVLAHFIDIMPTLCDVADARYPLEYNGRNIESMAGESLFPLLRGKSSWSRTEPLFFEWGAGAAVNDGQWKIVRLTKEQPWSLYNVAEDPSETQDLSAKYPQRVAKMDAMFADWKAGKGRDLVYKLGGRGVSRLK